MISLRGLHPEVRERAEWVVAVMQHYGVTPRVTSGFRSWAEQLALRERYLAGRSQFPANAPGDSAHNYGLAWDAVLPDSVRGRPDWEAYWTALREYAGFAVPANDTIHAEVPNWRQYVE